ncbi:MULTISPECIES: helix-turn-helix transcriptional regulator [unclassified Streptomyces]|uniref:helix-turn-helix domain-containing protein n=1 Tax=unclassified Streptomyces TaxID=2593676 RepID=UPI00344256D9
MAGSGSDRGASVSTVLGCRLGGELLRMREERGMRQAEAAKALTASVAKVAKMERGLVPMRDPDIRALCHLYGERGDAVIDRLLELAKADRDRRKAKGWWNQYPQLRSQAEYFALEDIATEMRTWQITFVPGLLQTPDYARALAVGNGSWDDLDEIEPFVEARMARQACLEGDRPLQLCVALHEGALRQLVGDRDVMRSQLARMLEAAELQHVRLRIVPFSAGAHPGMTSAFTVVSFGEPGALDVVQSDTISTKIWVENDRETARHLAIFDRIAGLGLDERDSISLIGSIRKEL